MSPQWLLRTLSLRISGNQKLFRVSLPPLKKPDRSRHQGCWRVRRQAGISSWCDRQGLRRCFPHASRLSGRELPASGSTPVRRLCDLTLFTRSECAAAATLSLFFVWFSLDPFSHEVPTHHRASRPGWSSSAFILPVNSREFEPWICCKAWVFHGVCLVKPTFNIWQFFVYAQQEEQQRSFPLWCLLFLIP